MKRETSWLSGWIFSFWIALAGLGCMCSGLSLDRVDLVQIARFLAVASLFAALWFRFVKKEWILPLFLLVLLWILFRRTDLMLSLEAFLNRLSQIYDSGYGWGVLEWSGEDLTEQSMTGAAALLGGIVVLAVSWTVCRRKWGGFALIPGALSMAACCVVTDTVPDTRWLYFLLAGIVLLMLTQGTRRKNSRDAVRLTAVLLVPVMLTSGLLFRAVPQDGYQEQINTVTQKLVEWVNQLPFSFVNRNGSGQGGTGLGQVKEVNLTDVGPLEEQSYAVMDVVSRRSELLYLRGQAYVIYNGTSWSVLEEKENFDLWPREGLEAVGTVSISTRTVHSLQYFPYYTSGTAWQETYWGGRIENTEKLKEYSFLQLVAANGYAGDFSAEVSPEYTALPDRTLEAALEILQDQGISPEELETGELARKIGEFVSVSAEYSLDTQTMPSEESDFAIWFLTESETGYCTHYATAAAVLLRAAGIPARYITGYIVQTQGGRRVTVTQDKAHAWVEYLDPDTGWTVLEATSQTWFDLTFPQENQPDGTQETGSQPTETETQPTETQTQPTETVTEPTETETRPTQTVTQPTESTTAATTVQTETVTQLPEETQDRWDPTPLIWILGIGSGIWLQYAVRMGIRKKRMRTGDGNQRGKYRWRQVLRMCRILKLQPPQELRALAEKAAFSQHILNGEELAQFDEWLTQAQALLKKKLGIFRWFVKLTLAI